MLQIKYKSWNTLPIGRYERIKEILRSEDEDKDVEILAVLCDCDVDDILNAPVGEVWSIRKEMVYIFQPLNIKDKLRYKTITIDGVKYVINTDFRNVTTAQYMDFQTFYKEFEKNYCNVLACFIIPEGHKYNDGYDAVEVAEIFREKLSVEVAENACFFFAKRSRISLIKGLTLLIWETLMMMRKTRSKRERQMMMDTVRELRKQREGIIGLGKLMMSHTLQG